MSTMDYTSEAAAVCGCGLTAGADCPEHHGRFHFRAHRPDDSMAARYSYDYIPGPPIVGSICVHTHEFKDAAEASK